MIVTIKEHGYILDCKENLAWEKEADKKPWAFVYHLALTKTKIDNEALNYLILLANSVINEIVCQPDNEFTRHKTKIQFSDEKLLELIENQPYLLGKENLTLVWLEEAIEKLLDCYNSEIKAYDGTVANYFASFDSSLKVANRLYFHLVENKDGLMPFAFMATYANKSAKHLPLSMALKEFKKDQDALLLLLAPLTKVANESALISSLMEEGELFKPIFFTQEEAYAFLKEIELYQDAGVQCRIPNFWQKKNKIKVRVSPKTRGKSLFGAAALLDFNPQIIVDGVKLTRAELKDLIEGAQGLRQIKGKWIEVDKEKLQKLLDSYDELKNKKQMTLTELASGMLGTSKELSDSVEVSTQEWMDYLLSRPKTAKKEAKVVAPSNLNATLRPYQLKAFQWLKDLSILGFGSCLADDMGLGKTVELLAFLADFLSVNQGRALLVVPPSLCGNWEHEIQKFLPNQVYFKLTGPSKKVSLMDCEQSGIYITTYQLLDKLSNVKKACWDVMVLDEAQAIKNSTTQQAKTVKSVQATVKIALTGTPVENRTDDLWSLFDWLNPGLLGTKKEFVSFMKQGQELDTYARLRKVVSPFILRRMKTDKSIISDLPEKIEETSYPMLTKLQAKLYESVVRNLEKELNEKPEGIRRKGLILNSLLSLKQICNHPSQYEGSNEYKADDSGKFMLLRNLCSTIRDNHERVLVFTQFKEIIPALKTCLDEVFGQEGLVLHGGTPVNKRTGLVDEFNAEHYCPYMILSLKAGGTGLNLTAANHVIHFDRWWNPAVENQATDRAYRIGQKKDVVVHTFVTKGTLEEQIDLLLSQKRQMMNDILPSSGETWITEMTDSQILDICHLQEV